MKLLVDLFGFFRRERVWGLLFLLLVGIYALTLFGPEEREEGTHSEAVKRFQLAEARLKDEIRSAGGVQGFLATQPKLLRIFEWFTFLLLGALFSGLVVDFFWLSRPAWRVRLLGVAGPPAARGWGLGAIFKTLLLFILTSVALTIFLAFLKALLFRGAPPTLFLLIHTTLSDLVCVGLVIFFVHYLGGNWRDLGFKGIHFVKDFWVGLVGYVAILPAFFLVLVGLVVLAQLLAYEPPPHPLVEVFLEEERSPQLIAYSLFLACVGGPFFEEIFFRGFCYPAFKKRWGVGWALVLSAAFFSLIHQNTFAFLPVFVLGLGLGYLYEKRGNLLPSIALHMVHNSVFISYFFLAKKVLLGS